MKIPGLSGLLQTSAFNSKIAEVENKITTAEGKIPNISNLVNKTAVENKIPNANNLVNKTELKNVQYKIPDVKNLTSKSELIAV